MGAWTPRRRIWRAGKRDKLGAMVASTRQAVASVCRSRFTELICNRSPAGATLSAMLATGDLDAVIAARPPTCFLNGVPNVGRLFPNFREAEENYFRKTGLFPVMHLIGIRRTLVENTPLARRRRFLTLLRPAREIAMSQLRYQGAFYAMLPWLPDDLARAQAVMGSDFWPYGRRGEPARARRDAALGRRTRAGQERTKARPDFRVRVSRR